MLEQDLDNLNEEIAYYGKRIAELKGFVAIGRNQRTGYFNCAIAAGRAHRPIETDLGQLRASARSPLLPHGLCSRSVRSTARGGGCRDPSVATYLARVDLRPDVMQIRNRQKAADENIPIARAGHLPTLSFQGDYYFEAKRSA